MTTRSMDRAINRVLVRAHANGGCDPCGFLTSIQYESIISGEANVPNVGIVWDWGARRSKISDSKQFFLY